MLSVIPKIKKITLFTLLMLLPALFALTGCDQAAAAAAAPSAELEILAEIQRELAELRAENYALRESNEALAQNLEELSEPQSNNTSDTTQANAQGTPNTSNTQNTPNDPIVIEIQVPDPTPSPTPSPTPTPTPAPASLFGRWVTVGALRGSDTINVPPEQSMEIEFSRSGTGRLDIEGHADPFSFTGGDTGYIGRIVMTFTGGFWGDSHSETMTYVIQGRQLWLTHDMFDENITTILRKAE